MAYNKTNERLAVLTVSYNSSSQIEEFIKSALESEVEPSNIFIIDNNSADILRTEQIVLNFGVNLIKLSKNLGYGGAINNSIPSLPLNLSTLLICNPDIKLNAEAISTLLVKVQSKSIGVAGPRIFNQDGTIYPSARSIPSIRDGIGHAIFANSWQNNPWTKSYLSEAHHQNSTVSTGWVSGACLAIRRELFNAVGGFDDNYFMYFEDVDLGYRLAKCGLTNLYVPEVSITHVGGESTKAIKKTMLRIHHESAMHFIQVKYKGFLWAPVRGVIRVGLALRFWLQARKATT